MITIALIALLAQAGPDVQEITPARWSCLDDGQGGEVEFQGVLVSTTDRPRPNGTRVSFQLRLEGGRLRLAIPQYPDADVPMTGVWKRRTPPGDPRSWRGAMYGQVTGPGGGDMIMFHPRDHWLMWVKQRSDGSGYRRTVTSFWNCQAVVR